MKNARYERLKAHVESAGWPVVEGGDKPEPIDPGVARLVGLREGIRAQGTYSTRLHEIRTGWPKRAPEWLRLGILAHEFGHHVAKLLDPGIVNTYYEWEREASVCAYEVLVGLGIKPSRYVRAVLNLSIASHGQGSGMHIDGIRRDFI